MIINVEEDSDINYEMEMEGTEPPDEEVYLHHSRLSELHLSMFHYELKMF
jgi:hypothetical protein